MWASAGQAATIGIFLLLFGAFLYIGHAILLPVLAAAVAALTLAPLVKAANGTAFRRGSPALFILLVALGAMSLVATALAGPVSEWIGRAPEIGATIKQKLSVLDQPLASLHELREFAVRRRHRAQRQRAAPMSSCRSSPFSRRRRASCLLFFATLYFFLVGQIELRNHAVSMFASHDSKLRFLKIMRDIERNLAGYLTVVTIVNIGVGTIVAVGAWLIGFPNPVIFGLLAGC